MDNKLSTKEPIYIYILAFLSSAKNANIYMWVGNTFIQLLFDYIYLILVLIILLWILMKKVIINNWKFDQTLRYVIPIFSWILTHSIVNTVFQEGNFFPRNLLTGYLTLIVLVLTINNQIEFKKAFWCFSFGAGMSALVPLSLHPQMIGSRISLVNNILFDGSFWNNVLVSFVSSSWLLMSYIQKKDTSKFERILGHMIFGLTWFGAFSGLSRSFLLITFSSVFMYLISSKYMKNNIKILIGALVMSFAVFYFFPSVIDRLLGRFSLSLVDISNEARIGIWRSYISNIPEYYFWGAIGDYRQFSPGITNFGPHSIFLNYFVQYGVIGALGFLILIYGVIREILNLKKKSSKEYSYLIAWLTSYISLVSINETGFIHTSFFSAIAFILLWKKS